MKLNISIFKKIILLFSVVLITTNSIAQKAKTNPEKQALFIYNFFKFVEWSNYEELQSFNVGVIGDKKNLVYDELVNISKTEKAKKLPIKIKRLKNLSQLDDIQLLYFDKGASLKFEKIYTAIGDKHILLVSKGYPSAVSHFSARANGGSPSAVGKYLSTSGNSNGKSLSANTCGTPSLKYTGKGSPQ